MSYFNPMNDSVVVIEETETKIDSYCILIYITIAFVYAIFLSLLVDRILNYDRVEKVCNVSIMPYFNKSEEESPDKFKMCQDAKKEYDTQKFIYMIVLGLLSLFGGAFLARYDNNYTTGGMGVALGGIFLILYYTVANWTMLNRNLQTVVLGLTFAILFIGSMFMYQRF